MKQKLTIRRSSFSLVSYIITGMIVCHHDHRHMMSIFDDPKDNPPVRIQLTNYHVFLSQMIAVTV